MPIIKSPETGKVWLKHHVEILRQWKAKAFVHLWLHAYSTYHYMSLNNWLSYPIIFISTFCSATVLSTEDYRVYIVIGVLTMINAIVSGFNRQLNPGSMMQQHSQLNRRYANLVRSIDTCLSLTEKMRPHPSVFIERVGVEIDNLADANIDYPESVVKKFEKEFGPMDRLLYGENIVELVKIGKKTGTTVNDIRRRSQLVNEGGAVDDTDNFTMETDEMDISGPNQRVTPDKDIRPMLPFKLLAGNMSSTSFALSKMNQTQMLSNIRNTLTTSMISGNLDAQDIYPRAESPQLPTSGSHKRSSIDSGSQQTVPTNGSTLMGSTISLKPMTIQPATPQSPSDPALSSTFADDLRGVRKSIEMMSGAASRSLKSPDMNMASLKEEPSPGLSRAETTTNTPSSSTKTYSPFHRRMSNNFGEISMKLPNITDLLSLPKLKSEPPGSSRKTPKIKTPKVDTAAELLETSSDENNKARTP